MRSSQDESHLEEAIKTTLAQLCKVSTVYQSELLIEGTIGLTIDRKKVVLVHFQDRAVTMDSEGPALGASALPSSSASTAAQENEICNLKLLGAEALSSLQDILARPLVSNDANEANKLHLEGKQRTFCETTALDGTTIELDSDEESFSGMNFDTVSEVKVKGGLLAKHTTDTKNTIVIDDDFFDSTPIDNAYSQVSGMGENVAEIGDVLGCSHSNVMVISEDLSSKPKRNPSPKLSQCQCEVCGKSLPTQSSLEAHLVAAHKITETPQGKISHFTCKTCDKHFRFKAALKKHEKKHFNDRPFKCASCQNSYSTAASLEIHSNVHANRLKCDACNKAYSCKALFQKHIKYMHENV